MPTKTSTTRLRKAGVLEAFFHARSKLGVDNCVVVAAKYESNTARVLDKPTLFAAIQEVINENPVLAARLTERGPNGTTCDPVWVRLPFLDLNHIVSFLDVDSSDLESLLAKEFTRPFELDVDSPLWRVAVLTDGTVMYTHEHSMGDGQSGLAFHLAILSALEKLPETASHSGEVVIPDVPLRPALEEAMPITAPVSKIFKEVNQAINPFAARKRNAIWTGNPVGKTYKRGVNIRVIRLSPEDTASLLRLCRKNGATLTGALYALITHIIAQELYAGPDPKGKLNSVVMFVPISLRPHTSAPPTAICNYVSYYQDVYPLPVPTRASKHSYPSPDRFAWKSAASFSATLKREAPKAPAAIGVMKALIGSRENYSLGLLGKKRETTVEISNLGAAKPVQPTPGVSATPKWTIPEAVFAQADSTTGAAFKFNVVGAPAGGLGISVTCGLEAVDEEFAEKVIDAFAEGLKALASYKDEAIATAAL
ncbi:alcohol acetyltransferase [Cubamyces menziesii]|uniref:Alcohol acetyltransferase n=1 Tax=Trametes cubensis TaxID=1111947 RepID=A0AAD7U437_9APHY|nr:alcohol acetyltransferase [Cubamyces menziesii]KAJ8502245.1 hypothetical protein ONZ51_g74 [Trametes cubensis]